MRKGVKTCPLSLAKNSYYLLCSLIILLYLFSFLSHLKQKAPVNPARKPPIKAPKYPKECQYINISRLLNENVSDAAQILIVVPMMEPMLIKTPIISPQVNA